MENTAFDALDAFEPASGRSVAPHHSCCCHALVEDLFADED